ncbi:M23 family metallopeptidase [Desulfolutivibrio sulfoxidireducens]|uniref:M23 family metallopeptidase n=1 Tax=Desulfolutivibrio sulfoxidireducens TaxID=2773299 RepID=UPI00159D1346|nr:M23 family metallopeptidase [Desulfolutivibrio sulfoxidireducens]QLA16379.1 peptidoglycan DD-metalloendopeptidase family protein [Desulfolutivibrio sulfoxidireducens]QLA19740.1 peptidoglycan DD-metalloendopeptidase family protein [Desulfolutivibrio sulfoxidireducens]
MRIRKPYKKKKKIGPIGVLVIALALLVPIGAAGVGALYLMEDMEKPTVTLYPDIDAVSLKKEFTVKAGDPGSGIKSLVVTAGQGLKKYTVLRKSYDALQKSVLETFSLEKAELRGGEFDLQVVATDGSFFNFGAGNSSHINKRMTLDLSPPNVRALTPTHYMRQGGVGLVIYTVSKDPERSGVMVGDRFFPGFKQDSGQYLCLFAYPRDVEAEDFKPRLYAEDKAGNERTGFFVNMAIKRRFRDERVDISDEFLAAKMPAFASLYPDVRDPLALFRKVNDDLRRKDEAVLRDLGRKTSPKPLWNGPFVYLRGSSVLGSFGAMRSYYYKGEKIDEQCHLGIDLASTPAAPVPAANDGSVVFVGNLGLYGQTVVIDHGLGLQTLYGHLSRIDVKAGEFVTKGQFIGRTGSTGLAFGDHLHFGVALSGQEVIPIEWWDAKWLEDNVTQKIRRFGETPQS